MAEELKSLTLHDAHVEQGARMVPFAGYEMPMFYSGIVEEHLAVRQGVGVFDVSHMGEFFVRGAAAVAAVDRVVTNDITSLALGKAAYTLMCQEDGGIVDDLIVYKFAEDEIMLVVNAACRAKDWAHIEANLQGDVQLVDESEETTLLAIQGPKALELIGQLVPEAAQVAPFGLVRCDSPWGRVAIARTGYTGEDGVEFFVKNEAAQAFYAALFEAGEAFGLKPAGLGCRDTLRLEARLPLYGNDITLETNPLEAGLGWAVKFDKAIPFVGREALLQLKKDRAVYRRLRGVILEGRGVLRPGYSLYLGERELGKLTSGSVSPSTQAQAIGLAYVHRDDADLSEGVEVEIRGRRLPVRLTRKPFYRRSN